MNYVNHFVIIEYFYDVTSTCLGLHLGAAQSSVYGDVILVSMSEHYLPLPLNNNNSNPNMYISNNQIADFDSLVSSHVKNNHLARITFNITLRHKIVRVSIRKPPLRVLTKVQ